MTGQATAALKYVQKQTPLTPRRPKKEPSGWGGSRNSLMFEFSLFVELEVAERDPWLAGSPWPLR
eukprot:9920102-Alexandrium_andersonii.AAC.1